MIIVSHTLIYALLSRQNPARFEPSTENEVRDREKEESEEEYEEPNKDVQVDFVTVRGALQHLLFISFHYKIYPNI